MDQLQKQNQARVNGAKSSGPKTPEGRKRCAEYARQAAAKRRTLHTAVAPGESLEVFEKLREAAYSELRPAGALQCQIVDEIVITNWLIRRLFFSKSHDIASQFAEAAKSATQGATEGDLIAIAEIQAAVEGVRQPGLDRSIQRLIGNRSGLLRQLDKLQKKSSSKVQISLQTQKLALDPEPAG